ncbi:MAG: glutamate synthase subunit beta [Lachnospiraceae bacterium]|nr:glutamate synthase subunit beta [Lachnospiraceae bacterium]
MGKPTGFLEYERVDAPVIEEEKRVKNFDEFHGKLSLDKQREQAARCMDCGVAFCQAGLMIAGMVSGCPLHNLIPETNELVYKGKLEQAYNRLAITHSFPEFTSRVCPALCEAACTCSLHNEAVTVKENEKAIIEYAFENGLVKEEIPSSRTGKKVAVVGSGPSGLAAAQLLNRRGHEVTVYERSDRAGGLLRYGIPNMKLDKKVIDRRIAMMEEAGIKFVYNANVGGADINSGVDKLTENTATFVDAAKLKEDYDSVILACGASNPRDIAAPGREAKGIYFAVDFLGTVTKKLLDSDFKDYPYELAKDKDVIVIGGGDTGNDCVGTCMRLGAKSILQLEMMPQAAAKRLPNNPWPEWPKVLKTDYGQEEAAWKFGSDPRMYQATVKEFIKDEKGNLKEVVIVSLEPKKDKKTGRVIMAEKPGTEKTVPAQLVLICAGFLGSEQYVTENFGVETDQRTNVKTACGKHETSVPGVYTAGDMHRGQSLVVWAIAEGRSVAKEVDKALMGYTNL